MKALKIVAAILGILLAGFLVDWIAGREERAILAPLHDAIAAIESKNWAGVEAALDPGFSYRSSVSWVGQGTLDGARAKLESFWPRVDFFAVVLREAQVESSGDAAKAEIQGNLKFGLVTGGFAIYKLRAIVDLRKAAGRWRVLAIDLPQLEPGIF